MGRPESIQSKGAPAALRAVGNKENGPPGGPRENAPGAWKPSVLHEVRMGPWTPPRMVNGSTKIPRPKRRGLRGNMVPPSNRARPAVRCRTAFPQKCRDCPPGVFSLGPLQRPVLFLRQKENGGLGALPLGRRKKRGLWPQKKVMPRLRRGMLSASMRYFERCGFAAEKRMGGWGLFPLGRKKSAAFGRRKRFGRAYGAEYSALGGAVLSGAASPRCIRAASRQKSGAAFAAI